jgi:hypothetical protein
MPSSGTFRGIRRGRQVRIAIVRESRLDFDVVFAKAAPRDVADATERFIDAFSRSVGPAAWILYMYDCMYVCLYV